MVKDFEICVPVKLTSIYFYPKVSPKLVLINSKRGIYMTCERKEVEPSLGISRREFFTFVTMLLGGMITSVLGWNLGRYFISPAWKRTMEGWVEVVSLEILSSGVPTNVNYIQRKIDGWMTVEGLNSVWLLREGDEVTAFNPKCTHLGCPYRWDEEKNSFVCPCHTAVFSKTGEVVSGPPPRPLDRFPIKIENGIVMILPESKEEGDRV